MSLSTASILLVLGLPLSCLCPQHPSTLSLVFLFHVSVHSIHLPCPWSSPFMSLSTASIHLVLSLPLSCLCPQHPSTLSSVFLFRVSVHSIHPPCPQSSSFMSLFTASIHLVRGLPLSCLCPQHPSTLSLVFLFHVSVHSIHLPCPRSSSFMSLSTASIHLVLGLPLFPCGFMSTICLQACSSGRRLTCPNYFNHFSVTLLTLLTLMAVFPYLLGVGLVLLLHSFRYRATSWVTPTHVMSSLICWCHVFLGRPRRLVPGIASSITLRVTLSASRLWTCPNQRRRPPRITSSIGETCSMRRISSFRT